MARGPPLGPSNCSLPGVTVMVNLDCQLHWAEKCLGDLESTLLGEFMEAFPERTEFNQEVALL